MSENKNLSNEIAEIEELEQKTAPSGSAITTLD